MAIVTSYATEDHLGSYMLVTLGRVAETLGWRTPQDLAEPVQETLWAYGASDVASITGEDNLRRLRALARVEAWRAAKANLAAMHDFTTPEGSASKDQLYRHVSEMLADAQAAAAPYSRAYTIAIDRITYPHDPYLAIDDTERVLP